MFNWKVIFLNLFQISPISSKLYQLHFFYQLMNTCSAVQKRTRHCTRAGETRTRMIYAYTKIRECETSTARKIKHVIQASVGRVTAKTFLCVKDARKRIHVHLQAAVHTQCAVAYADVYCIYVFMFMKKAMRARALSFSFFLSLCFHATNPLQVSLSLASLAVPFFSSPSVTPRFHHRIRIRSRFALFRRKLRKKERGRLSGRALRFFTLIARHRVIMWRTIGDESWLLYRINLLGNAIDDGLSCELLAINWIFWKELVFHV